MVSIITLQLLACATLKVKTEGDMLRMSFKSQANEVEYYSSFNKFMPIKASKNGEWHSVTIKDTAKMKYFLKADGQIYLPDCKIRENDDFGGELCIYEKVIR